MNKKSLGILMVITLIFSITVPVFAETIITDNLQGVVVDEILADQVMENNYGTVTINNGKINNNNGTVASNRSGAKIGTNNYRVHSNENCGIIETNLGIIEENSGSVTKNNFHSSIINKVVNTASGKVEENNANVSGGSIDVNNGTAEYATIEKNYSKEVINSTINNNYSDEVGENNIIKKNFAKKISNAIVENQYYKLTLIGNINLEATIDLDGDLTNNIFVDSEGQTWIRAEDAMYTITPKKGYRITGEDVTASGDTIVGWEGPRQLGLTNVSGEIIVEAETEELLNYPIREGNEFKVDRLKDETLTITVNNGNDSVKKIQYKKLGDDEYKQATAGFSTEVLDNGEERFVFRKKPFFENLENAKYQFEFISRYGTAIAIIEISGDESSIGGIGGSSSMPSETQPAPTVETVQEVKLNNPQTGNSIIIWFAILIVSVIGIIITRKKQ